MTLKRIGQDVWMSKKNFDPWGPGRPPAGGHGAHQGSLEYSYLAWHCNPF